VGVLVLPADHGRETLVVDQHRHGRAGAGALLALLGVEGAPLGALVDEGVVEHEAAGLADHLAPAVVGGDVVRPALGAGGDLFDLAVAPLLLGGRRHGDCFRDSAFPVATPRRVPRASLPLAASEEGPQIVCRRYADLTWRALGVPRRSSVPSS